VKSHLTDEEKAEFDDLKKKFKDKIFGQLNVGLDPEAFMYAVKLARLILKSGARRFSEYSKVMIESFGDEVRPHLKGFYEYMRRSPEGKEFVKDMTPTEEVDRTDVFDIKLYDEPLTKGEEINNLDKKENDVLNTAGHSQSDSRGVSAEIRPDEQNVPAADERAGRAGGEQIEGRDNKPSEGEESSIRDSESSSEGSTPVSGEGSDSEVHGQEPRVEKPAAGDFDSGGRSLDNGERPTNVSAGGN
jgi:hypothetical protein